MDKSELFVRMCDCSEVQNHRKQQRNFQIGDYIAIFELGKFSKPRLLGVIVFDGSGSTLNRQLAQLAVWLPMQHQTQKMLGDFLWTSIFMRKFYGSKYDFDHPMTTWEQRWLCIYMYEKHGKLWMGDKWIEAKAVKK